MHLLFDVLELNYLSTDEFQCDAMTNIKIPVSPWAAPAFVAAVAPAAPGLMTIPGIQRREKRSRTCVCDSVTTTAANGREIQKGRRTGAEGEQRNEFMGVRNKEKRMQKEKNGIHYFEERGGKKAKTDRSEEVETVCWTDFISTTKSQSLSSFKLGWSLK